MRKFKSVEIVSDGLSYTISQDLNGGIYIECADKKENIMPIVAVRGADFAIQVFPEKSVKLGSR